LIEESEPFGDRAPVPESYIGYDTQGMQTTEL